MIGDGAVEPVGVGQGARIGLACGWLVAVKLQFLDDAGGGGAVVSGLVKHRRRCREELSWSVLLEW